MDKAKFKKIALLILIGVGSYWLLQNYQPILSILRTIWILLFPFILGLIIAFLLNLPMKAIEKHLFKGRGGKLKRPISFVLTILFVLLLIGFLVFMVVPQIVAAVQQLSAAMPGYLAAAEKSLTPYLKYVPQLQEYVMNLDVNWADFAGKAWNFLQSGAGSIFSSAVGVASSIIGGAFSFFLGLIFACYVLLDKEHLGAQFKGFLQAYLPQKAYAKLMDLASLSDHIFSKFVAGQCTEGLVIGAIFSIVLFLSGFDYALLIGVLIGFMSLIPVFGTTIACILGALLLLMSQGLGRSIAFVILFLVIQQIDGNFIYPHIVGTSVGLPPMWVLIAVTLGGSLMGISGMFFGIPLTSVIYTLLHRDALERLNKKGILSPVKEMAGSTPPPKEKRKKPKEK